MLTAGILLAAGLVLLGLHNIEAAITLTPNSQLCETFRDNAMLTFGATCWKKGANTYLGGGEKKKHQFLKAIVETSGGSIPYEYTDTFEATVASWGACVAHGDWVPVTGAGQIGDIVVTDAHMGMVIKLGDRSMIIQDGRLLTRGTQAEIDVRDVVHDPDPNAWRVCKGNSTEFPVGTIDPSAPPEGCPSWTLDTATVTKVSNKEVGNWIVIRAARTAVDIFHPAFPMKDQMCVYRYVPTVIWDEATPQCVCLGSGPNEIVEAPCGPFQRNEGPLVCMRTVNIQGTCIDPLSPFYAKTFHKIDSAAPCFIEDADYSVQPDDVPCQFVSECMCVANIDKPVFGSACGAQLGVVRSVCYKTIGADETCLAGNFKKIGYGENGGYIQDTDGVLSAMFLCELNG